jgi:hypothetical protein
VKKATGTPPYMPRKGLNAVLDQIQAHQKGEILAREDLHRRGLSSHWTYPAMAALRFLDILDDHDRLTGRHVIFDREKPDRPAQQALLKEAYADLFEAVQLPAAGEGALKEKFQEVYKLSERVANSAYPIFEMLATDAGVRLLAQAPAEEGGAQRPARPAGGEGPEEGSAAEGATDAELLQRATAREEPVRIRHTGYQIVINLQVTKYTTEKDLIKMVRTANRAIHLLKKAGDSH